MRILKTILLITGLVSSIMLVSPTTVLSGTKTCMTTDFQIQMSVTVTNVNGRSIYEYNPISLTAAPNKFFIYIKRDLDDPETGDIVVTLNGTVQDLDKVYLHNGETPQGAPLSKVWDDNTHNDAINITSIASNNFPIVLNVKEREPGREQEDETTILLPVGSSLQACGPIEGPMQAQKRFFEGNPLVQTDVEQTMANGCRYNISFDPVTNLVTNVIALTERATVAPFELCEVTIAPHICEDETGLTFCPPGRINNPPLQDLPGGTCYYPSNIKFSC
jgi:hypothetical protein